MMYHSNVLYNEPITQPILTHYITQDDEANVELGKGEVVSVGVGITTVKRLPSPSVYTHRSVETRARVILEHYCSPALTIIRNGVPVYKQRNKVRVIMEVSV